MPDSASLVSDRIFPRCHSRETCEASTLGSLLLPKPPVGPSSPLESPSRPWSQITERAVVERPTQVGTALHQLRELGAGHPAPSTTSALASPPWPTSTSSQSKSTPIAADSPSALVRPPVRFAEWLPAPERTAARRLRLLDGLSPHKMTAFWPKNLQSVVLLLQTAHRQTGTGRTANGCCWSNRPVPGPRRRSAGRRRRPHWRARRRSQGPWGRWRGGPGSQRCPGELDGIGASGWGWARQVG